MYNYEENEVKLDCTQRIRNASDIGGFEEDSLITLSEVKR